jgi:hypothetical protein
MARRIALALALAGCHVVTRNEIARPSSLERVRRPDAAIARAAALVLGDDGRFRFVEPLECPTEEIVTQTRAVEIVTRPNLATFVVGVIATAVGGVLAVRGISDAEPNNPFTYSGIASLGAGLPLAIGPWLGTRTELSELPAPPPERRPGANEPCGERALAARSATLTAAGIEVYGKIDANGTFAVPAYAIVDAFEAATAPALAISARVDAIAGPRTVEVVFEGNAFAVRAKAFLAGADFDPKIEPMRLVPGLSAGLLRVSLTSTDAGPAVRVVLPLRNDGPGPAWAVRGRVVAPGAPAIDGRVLYVGHVAKGAAVTRELWIPITPFAATALRNANLDVAVELRDAHGTAPTTPIRYRGPLLGDAPR